VGLLANGPKPLPIGTSDSLSKSHGVGRVACLAFAPVGRGSNDRGLVPSAQPLFSLDNGSSYRITPELWCR
jgi:hypothetical protein